MKKVELEQPLAPTKAEEGFPITAAAKIDKAKKSQRTVERKRPGRSKATTPREIGETALTCESETLLMAGYLSSQLSPRTLIAFENHLKLCPDCQAFLHTYKKTVELTRAFLELEPAKSRPRNLALRRRNRQSTRD